MHFYGGRQSTRHGRSGALIGYFFEESEANEIGDETLYSYSRWELFPDGLP